MICYEDVNSQSMSYYWLDIGVRTWSLFGRGARVHQKSPVTSPEYPQNPHWSIPNPSFEPSRLPKNPQCRSQKVFPVSLIQTPLSTSSEAPWNSPKKFIPKRSKTHIEALRTLWSFSKTPVIWVHLVLSLSTNVVLYLKFTNATKM